MGMPMLRPDTTVDTTATTPTATDTPTTDTDTVPMATTLMPTTTESRSAIIKLYTKVFFLKMQCKPHTSGFIPTKPYKPIVRREFWILTLIQCKTKGDRAFTQNPGF